MTKVGNIIITVGSWLIFLAAWLTLVVRLVLHWSVMSGDMHLDLVFLLLFFGMLWEELVRKKNDAVNLFMVSFALLTVVDLVRRVS